MLFQKKVCIELCVALYLHGLLFNKFHDRCIALTGMAHKLELAGRKICSALKNYELFVRPFDTA